MSKHLTLEDRFQILNGLNQRLSLRQIAKTVHKHPSTITNEILKHYVTEQSGAYGRAFNDCLLRKTYPNRKDRAPSTPCFKTCLDYQKEKCHLLDQPPYVCHGCPQRIRCTLEKNLYFPKQAYQSYCRFLKEARSGFNMDQK